MTTQVTVWKGRRTKLLVALGYDVSQDDSLHSEIRADQDRSSELIATWEVAFATDGQDGELILTLDDEATATITRSNGYMDIKRIVGGEPYSAWDEPIEVLFKEPVTV